MANKTTFKVLRPVVLFFLVILAFAVGLCAGLDGLRA